MELKSGFQWQRFFILSFLRFVIASQVVIYSLGIAHFLSTLVHFVIYREFNFSFGLLFVIADVLFIIACAENFREETYQRDHLLEASSETIANIEAEIKDKRSTKCAKVFMQGWMFDTPIESISRADLQEWISGMIFHKHVNEISQESFVKVMALVDMYEKIIGMPLLDTGSSPKINLYFDKMDIFLRPLVYYTVTGMFGLLTKFDLKASQFQYQDLGGIGAFIRFGQRSEKPIILFHGFGIGLLPYISFINGLVEKYPNRTIVLFELKCLAMRMNLDFMLPEEFAQKTIGFLQKYDISEVTAIGHSFGTACMCWLDTFYPGLIKSRIFIDPICFALWTPDIARNFMYRNATKFKL